MATNKKAEKDAAKTSPWNTRINGFAVAVSRNVQDINKVLEDLVGPPSDEALAVLEDINAVPDADLKAAFANLESKIPSGVLNQHLSKLRGIVTSTANPADVATANAYDSILPTVPEDSSFLEMLKVGGELKVGTTAVLSAIKAAIANKLKLYDLPVIIKNKMEAFADEQDEPVGEEYFKLQKLVVSRNYAEVLNALGIEGQFMSEARKNAFFKKLDQYLWVSLRNFHELLTSWNEAWTAGASNPAVMMSFLLMGKANNGTMMPPGMMNPPETAGLHDEAEAVINSINKVFAGVGIPVAMALAYDATRIKAVLENPQLPASVGSANRDQMLKSLNIAVGADYIRMERNLTRYALAIMEFPKITVPNEEYAYLGAMLQLGASINWEKLGLHSAAGIGQL